MPKSQKGHPLTMGDKAELLEMITNTKLLAMKLMVYHNENKGQPTAAQCANDSVVLQRFSQQLLEMSRYYV